MYPAKFDYLRAQSVDEAIQLLQKNSGAKLLAGGHSLIPMMKLRLAQPPMLIDIGRIPDLSGITTTDGRVRIGSLTTHAELASSDVLRRECPILAEAAEQIADPQVRNKGTIGGNLAHADPGSDLPAVILALEGTLHFKGPEGERQTQAADFFLDLMMTDLRPGEVLTAIEVQALEKQTGSCYLKFEHPASGYAICGAAAIVTTDGKGNCQSAHLCFNGITTTPYNAAAVTEALAGKKLDEKTIDTAVNENISIDDPMGDTFASGPYRVELAKIYGRRALKKARDRAGK